MAQSGNSGFTLKCPSSELLIPVYHCYFKRHVSLSRSFFLIHSSSCRHLTARLSTRAQQQSPQGTQPAVIIPAETALELGLVGLLSRPVINAVFPSQDDTANVVDSTKQETSPASSSQSSAPPQTPQASVIPALQVTRTKEAATGANLERNNSTSSSIYATPMNIMDDRSNHGQLGYQSGQSGQPGSLVTNTDTHPFLNQGAGGATIHDAAAASPISPDEDLRRRTMNLTVVDNMPVSQNCWPDKGSQQQGQQQQLQQQSQTQGYGNTPASHTSAGQPDHSRQNLAIPSNRSVTGGQYSAGAPSRNTFNAEDFDVADRRLDRDPNAPPTPPPDPMKGGILGFGAGAAGGGLAHHIYADHQSPSKQQQQFAAPQPRKAESFKGGEYNQSQGNNYQDQGYQNSGDAGQYQQQQQQGNGAAHGQGFDQNYNQANGPAPGTTERVEQANHELRNAAAGGLAGGALAGGALAAGQHHNNSQVVDGQANGDPSRPQLGSRLSRSYINDGQTPVQTQYERPLDDGGLSRRSTTTGKAGSQRKSAMFVESIPRSQSRQSNKIQRQIPDPYADPPQRPATAHGHSQGHNSGEFGNLPPAQQQQRQRPASAMAGSVNQRDRDHRDRDSRRSSYASTRQGGGAPLSPSQSLGRRGNRLPPIADDMAYGAVGGAAGGLALGEVASLDRQHDMQANGVQLNDDGPIPPYPPGARPRSQFGYRPEPQYAEGGYNGRPDSRFGRQNTMSRSATLGRNGTLQRAANGGTIGSRRGAFGRGAGMSVGTQPEEILGRDDIHTRAELSERVLDDATLRKLSHMEKRDAKKLAKLLRAEGKEQARAVELQIKDMKRLASLQRDAIKAERKSQHDLGKWTQREHRARMRFLKEKERYEKVEGELRNAENDYEERRDQAAGLTAQIAERTQDLDDMRAQKAADDREREVKLIALKNPAHA